MNAIKEEASIPINHNKKLIFQNRKQYELHSMGERLLFRDVYDTHIFMVYNLCLSYVQKVVDAEELSQNVFVKVHKKLPEFKAQSSLKTWIYRITINECLDFIKAQKRQKRIAFISSIFNDKGEERSALLPDMNHPGIQLENKEAVERIYHHMNSLSDRQKTALILKVIEGFSQKEIAETMELSEKAVESLLVRARQKLKKKLDEREG